MSDAGLMSAVIAQNRANAHVNEFRPKLIEVFKSLVGQKILKADGCLMAKIVKLLPEFPHDHSVRIMNSNSHRTLNWEVSVNVQVGESSGCVYKTAMMYIGDLNGLEFEGVYEDHKELRTDFSPREIKAKRLEYAEARTAARDAESALEGFGAY